MQIVGNCTQDNVIEELFGDATGLAQAVEKAKAITEAVFVGVGGQPNGNANEFSRIGDYIIEYNPDTDIHTFWEV